MKKIYIGLLTFFFIMMIIFTFGSEEIYRRIHPKVEIIRISNMMTIADITYPVIPKTALIDNEYVYIVITNKGFSMDILTIEKRKVEWKIIEDETYDDNHILIISGVNIGDKIIINNSEDLIDGMRVTVQLRTILKI